MLARRRERRGQRAVQVECPVPAGGDAEQRAAAGALRADAQPALRAREAAPSPRRPRAARPAALPLLLKLPESLSLLAPLPAGNIGVRITCHLSALLEPSHSVTHIKCEQCESRALCAQVEQQRPSLAPANADTRGGKKARSPTPKAPTLQLSQSTATPQLLQHRSRRVASKAGAAERRAANSKPKPSAQLQ